MVFVVALARSSGSLKRIDIEVRPPESDLIVGGVVSGVSVKVASELVLDKSEPIEMTA